MNPAQEASVKALERAGFRQTHRSKELDFIHLVKKCGCLYCHVEVEADGLANGRPVEEFIKQQ